MPLPDDPSGHGFSQAVLHKVAASGSGLLGLAAAFVPFAIATSVTPGPNTTMLASSGATFGVWRTLPHIIGIIVGFPLMVVAVGIGLTGIFHDYPSLFVVLKFLGAGYLLYLAWMMATNRTVDGSVSQARRPFSFVEAAMFQWVNPKAWVMAAGASSVYIDPSVPVAPQLALITLIFLVVAVPTTVTWTSFGALIGRSLAASPARLRQFNVLMAGLLAFSLLPALV